MMPGSNPWSKGRLGSRRPGARPDSSWSGYGLGYLVLAIGLLGGAAWLAASAKTTGDYVLLAGPFLDAAARGDWSEFLAGPISMGPLALIVRLPFVLFAAAADAGELARYRAGIVPCAGAAALLAWAIALRARRAGAAWPMVFVFAGLALASPYAFEAIKNGHPEELLTGALLVGAMLAAPRRSFWLVGALLGLAIATKQWALVGVFPVALAAPRYRLQLLAWAAAIVVVLNAPLVATHPDRFYSTQEAAASASTIASFANVWFPFLEPGPRYAIRDGERVALSETRRTPAPISRLAHPLIVILPALLALVAWLRRSIDVSNMMALLVVALLLRCLLDPLNNAYYELPALMALLAWEAQRRPRGQSPAPILSAAMAVAGWLTFLVLPGEISLTALNAFFLAWSLPLLGAMLWFAFRSPERGRSCAAIRGFR